MIQLGALAVRPRFRRWGRDGTKWVISKMSACHYGIRIAPSDVADWYANTLSDAKQP